MVNNMDKYEINEKIADILLQSRYASGKSQQFIAERIGVTTRTIQNWECCKSAPDVSQFYQWFNAIQIPPQQYILKILYPDVDFNKFNDDSVALDRALCSFIMDLPIHEKKKLLFILEGSHGSSPSAVIDLMIANLQTPLRDRLGVCQTIISNYEMADELGMLTSKDSIRPSVDRLKQSLQAAIGAVKKRLNSYLN